MMANSNYDVIHLLKSIPLQRLIKCHGWRQCSASFPFPFFPFRFSLFAFSHWFSTAKKTHTTYRN